MTDITKKDKWVMLGKPECLWCKEAMQLLWDKGIEYTYMTVVGNELTFFLINCGLVTVPQIYKNGELIGGYDELLAYFTKSEPRPPIYPAEWNDEHMA